MKALINLHPSLSNTATTVPFSFHMHSQTSIFLRTITKLKLNKNPNFPPTVSVINSLANYSKPSNPSHSRGLCTGGVAAGEIHVIVGPIFVGKTTTLLKRMKIESSHGRSVAIIKSIKDARYGLNSIVTHDGEKLPCLPLADLFSFRERLGFEEYDELNARCEVCGKRAFFTLRKTDETKTELIAGAENTM